MGTRCPVNMAFNWTIDVFLKFYKVKNEVVDVCKVWRLPQKLVRSCRSLFVSSGVKRILCAREGASVASQRFCYAGSECVAQYSWKPMGCARCSSELWKVSCQKERSKVGQWWPIWFLCRFSLCIAFILFRLYAGMRCVRESYGTSYLRSRLTSSNVCFVVWLKRIRWRWTAPSKALR